APEALEIGGAKIGGSLQQIARDALQGEEDRQHGKGNQQRRQGEQDGVQIIDEEGQRLIDQPQRQQRPVEKAVAAQDAADGVDLDHIAHQQRHNQQEQQRVFLAPLQPGQEESDGIAEADSQHRDLEAEQ